MEGLTLKRRRFHLSLTPQFSSTGHHTAHAVAYGGAWGERSGNALTVRLLEGERCEACGGRMFEVIDRESGLTKATRCGGSCPG